MSDQLGSTDCAECRAGCGGSCLDCGLEHWSQTRRQDKLEKAVVALLRATSDEDEHEPSPDGPRD